MLHLVRTLSLSAGVLGASVLMTAGGALAQEPGFAHDESARAGENYRSWLDKNWKPDGTSARDLRIAGDAVMATGKDPQAAARNYARAVVTDRTDWRAWLGLAKALLATPADQLQGTNTYSTAVNAGGAAYVAYGLATEAKDKAGVLVVLAEALKRRSYWRPAIDALKTSLAFAEDASVRAAYEALKSEYGFRITDYNVDNEGTAPRVCIQFSEALNEDAASYKPFLSIDGREVEAVSAEGQQLCVDGLKHGERYVVRVRSGLPAAVDETLAKTADLSVFVRDRSPTVRLAAKAYVLPRRGQNGVPLTTINTEKVEIEILRVGDRGLAQQVLDGALDRQLGTWDTQNIIDRGGQKVYSGVLATRNERNAEITTAVPVSEIVPDMKPGVYALVAKPAVAGAASDDQATQWFVVSDMGLTAITAEDGLHAFVRSLDTARGSDGVTVKLVARNNEVLATAKTDGTGAANFEPGAIRGEGGMAPAVLVAESETGDYAFLDLTAAAFDLTDRGVKGRDAPGPIDAFLYTDRGVFRPGETINVSALLRTAAGKASALPLTVIAQRPDGVELRRDVLADQGHGGRTLALAMPKDAMTGTWRIKLHLDPKAEPIAETAVLVEDFLPERLALELKAEAATVSPGTALEVGLSGRYLYGPPAQDLAVEGEVVVKPVDSDPAYAGYLFGLSGELVSPVREELSDLPRTGDDGTAAVEIELPAIPQTAKPLEAKVVLRLREPGGRTIERSLSRPVVAEMPRIGVKPLFANLQSPEGEAARFEVIATDTANVRAARKYVAWRIFKLDRTWQWYKRDGSWTYDSAEVSRKVAEGTLDIGTNAPASLEYRPEWGRYRLELTATDPEATAPITTTVVFSSGWYQSDDADSPEVLDVALDRESYKPGETAKVKVATRVGGLATVVVLGDKSYGTQVVEIPAGGTEIPVPVGDDWGPGAYAAVLLHRPMDVVSKRMPSRALGLVWIGRDQADRTLTVSLDAPETMRSDREVTVPIAVSGLKAGEDARVTVAAVDLGILNLTRFKAPAPESYLHAQTKLGAEIRDLYGRLIDGMKAERGTMRSGGDADAGLAMQGAPPVAKTVSLFSGIVTVGQDGKAQVTFKMPEFNGTVRLMAVAWSDGKVGHGSRDMIVRDPVALTIATPRFLTLGDTAQMTFDVHNIEAAEGPFEFTVTAASDGVPVATAAHATLTLKQGERRLVPVTIDPKAIGPVTITTTIKGPGDIVVSRAASLEVSAPGGDVKRTKMLSLAPGKSLTVDAASVLGLVPGTGEVALSIGPTAPLNVPALLASLDRYPYGCTEQTVSRALPLLYANALAASAHLKTDDALAGRIRDAVSRVLTRQDSSGGFGLWGPGNADLWLTAYVGDFLTRAREKGHPVDPRGYDQAIDRLANYVAYEQEVRNGGGDLAYALYVLARNGRAPAGELRYYAESKLDSFTTPLAKAHLAAALAMIGDRNRAERTFETAFGALQITGAVEARADFGSGLRDGAALTALAIESKVAMGADMATKLGNAFGARSRTSTQEEAWLLVAANGLSETAADVRLDVSGAAHKGAFSTSATAEDVRKTPIIVRNDGTTATNVVLTTIGAASEPEPAAADGFTIERTYYTLAGEKVDLASAHGGTASIRQNDRLVVVLTVKAEDRGRVLVVDRLPAGLEIENPRLVESGSLSALPWLQTPIAPDHTEFRDDRMVASFDLFANQGGEMSVAYLVRAVTPGSYVHPAMSAEDMYRPERFARTATGRLTVTKSE